MEKYSCQYDMLYEQYYSLGDAVADEEKWSDFCCEAGNPVPGYVCELLESPDFKKAPANFE